MFIGLERIHNVLYNGNEVEYMEKNRSVIRLAGQEFKIAGDESNTYMQELADGVNKRISEVQKQYPMLSSGNCVLLAMLNMADELHKLRDDYDALDKRIAQLRDMPRRETPAAPVKRPFESRQKTTT